MEKMQVVILAGGKGTRLRPLTYKVPKPMVKVCGKPFLEYQLKLVKSYGLTNVLILVSYLGRQIEKYFGNGLHFGMEIKYSYEDVPMGTAGALKIAELMLDDSFILLNGDTLLSIDYNNLVSRFSNCGKIGLIVAYSNHDGIAPNNLKVSNEDIVLAYNKQDVNGMTHIDAGVILLKKKILDLIPEGHMCSLEKDIFCRLIADYQLQAFRTDEKFYDIGSIEGLKSIEWVLG